MSDLDPDIYQRALERARAMTLAEARRELQRVGVLDENGRLAPRYQPPSATSVGTSRQHSA